MWTCIRAERGRVSVVALSSWRHVRRRSGWLRVPLSARLRRPAVWNRPFVSHRSQRWAEAASVGRAQPHAAGAFASTTGDAWSRERRWIGQRWQQGRSGQRSASAAGCVVRSGTPRRVRRVRVCRLGPSSSAPSTWQGYGTGRRTTTSVPEQLATDRDSSRDRRRRLPTTDDRLDDDARRSVQVRLRHVRRTIVGEEPSERASSS